MPRFKDWKEGEVRIKLHVVTSTGAQIEYYMPHRSVKDGLAMCGMANNMMTGGTEVVEAAVRAVRKVDREREKNEKGRGRKGAGRHQRKAGTSRRAR